MTRVQVAVLDSVPEGSGMRVEAAGRRLALFRVGTEIFALADRCSHAEASLAEGIVDGCTVECPRHGATFDLRTGAALSFPATRPVTVYRVQVEDAGVFVEMREEGA
jgi:3-phenylpropionate/trans-cinnamate dioxygenase ferredoxin subunit